MNRKAHKELKIVYEMLENVISQLYAKQRIYETRKARIVLDLRSATAKLDIASASLRGECEIEDEKETFAEIPDYMGRISPNILKQERENK